MSTAKATNALTVSHAIELGVQAVISDTEDDSVAEFQSSTTCDALTEFVKDTAKSAGLTKINLRQVSLSILAAVRVLDALDLRDGMRGCNHAAYAMVVDSVISILTARTEFSPVLCRSSGGILYSPLIKPCKRPVTSCQTGSQTSRLCAHYSSTLLPIRRASLLQVQLQVCVLQSRRTPGPHTPSVTSTTFGIAGQVNLWPANSGASETV